MKLLSTKLTLVLLVVTIIGAAMVLSVRYVEACRLQQVVVNDEPVEDWSKKYEMLSEAPLISQPVDSLIESILSKRSVYKVDLKYDWPDALRMSLNDIDPVAMLLDQSTGRMFGLDQQGRLVRLKENGDQWERPVFTSVHAGRMFARPDDVRVKVVLDKLELLRLENLNLYRLMEEIDFGNSSFLKVTIDGLPFRVKVRAENLIEDMNRFVEFVTRYDHDLTDTKLLDVRFEKMIVASNGK